MPELLAEIPIATLSSSMISEDDLRDLGRGIAVHPEWRAAVCEERRPDDGGHRRAPAGHGGIRDDLGVTRSAYQALLPRKAMQEIVKLTGGCWRRREDPILRRRESPVLRDWASGC